MAQQQQHHPEKQQQQQQRNHPQQHQEPRDRHHQQPQPLSQDALVLHSPCTCISPSITSRANTHLISRRSISKRNRSAPPRLHQLGMLIILLLLRLPSVIAKDAPILDNLLAAFSPLIFLPRSPIRLLCPDNGHDRINLDNHNRQIHSYLRQGRRRQQSSSGGTGFLPSFTAAPNSNTAETSNSTTNHERDHDVDATNNNANNTTSNGASITIVQITRGDDADVDERDDAATILATSVPSFSDNLDFFDTQSPTVGYGNPTEIDDPTLTFAPTQGMVLTDDTTTSTNDFFGEWTKVNCSAEITHFVSYVNMTLRHYPIHATSNTSTASSTSPFMTLYGQVLQSTFQQIYNALRMHHCDQYFRHVTNISAVDAMNMPTRGNSAGTESQTHQDRTNTTSVLLEVHGVCRGCPTTESGNFEVDNDAFRKIWNALLALEGNTTTASTNTINTPLLHLPFHDPDLLSEYDCYCPTGVLVLNDDNDADGSATNNNESIDGHSASMDHSQSIPDAHSIQLASIIHSQNNQQAQSTKTTPPTAAPQAGFLAGLVAVEEILEVTRTNQRPKNNNEVDDDGADDEHETTAPTYIPTADVDSMAPSPEMTFEDS